MRTFKEVVLYVLLFLLMMNHDWMSELTHLQLPVWISFKFGKDQGPGWWKVDVDTSVKKGFGTRIGAAIITRADNSCVLDRWCRHDNNTTRYKTKYDYDWIQISGWAWIKYSRNNNGPRRFLSWLEYQRDCVLSW